MMLAARKPKKPVNAITVKTMMYPAKGIIAAMILKILHERQILQILKDLKLHYKGGWFLGDRPREFSL